MLILLADIYIIQQEIQLFCKSNKDGTQIGDCPFAQFIQVRCVLITTYFINISLISAGVGICVRIVALGCNL